MHKLTSPIKPMERFSHSIFVSSSVEICCGILHKLQTRDLILTEAMVSRVAVNHPLRGERTNDFHQISKKTLNSFHLFIKIQFGIIS